MAEIVNLRLARKRKLRMEKDEVAQANRARYGQTKADRDKRRAEGLKATKHLDGHKRLDD